MQGQLQIARRAFQDRRFEDALRSFAVAYSFSPSTEVLGKVAECAHKAEHHAEALALYERLLAEAPPPALRQEAERRITALRGILADEEVDVARLIRAQLDHAKRSFQNGRYEAAIQSFALAYALMRLPRVLFNIAQAERRSRHMVEAYLMYERLLQEEPGTQVRSEAEDYLAELRIIVARPPIHKQSWFWGSLAGGTAAAALAIGLGVGLSQSSSSGEGKLQLTFPLLTLQR